MLAICRRLYDDEEIELFVDGVLKPNCNSEKRTCINSIGVAERNLERYPSRSTLHHYDYRDFEYRDNGVRAALQNQIVDELITLPRTDDDDGIRLTVGGAAPKTELKAQKKAFYIIGSPASGKSMISNIVADLYGAYILDSDYVKRKLPEYNNQVGGATLVHDESDALIFGAPEIKRNLLKYCIENSYNMVIPKIGHNIESIIDFCSMLQKIGYEVYLISIDLDRSIATRRAYIRYEKTKRYVPLALIFDGYGNEPSLNYFKLKQRNNTLFSGYAQISTDVPIGCKGILLEETNIKELSNFWKETVA